MLLSDLLAACMLLTRLPVGRLAPHASPGPIARAVWAFPVVGAAVGALGSASFGICAWVGMPPGVGAVWALASMLLASGAFHEDGLADTADGFGGGRTRERKLEIMRDSRIGSFGAIALLLSLAARGTAIAAIGSPMRVAAALIVAAALSRAAILLPLLLLRPARPDGMAADLHTPDIPRVAAGFAIALLFAALLLPSGAALRGIAGALAAALAVTWLAQRHIGGYSGDVLGAAAVLAECAAISLIAGTPLNT